MGFFSRIKDSFSKFEIYNEVVLQRNRKTFQYFLILFTILFVIGSLRVAYNFNVRTTAMIKSAGERLPEFRFANGKLTVKGRQPLILEGDNNTAIIIDTSGKTNESVLGKYSEGVFVSKHMLVTKQNFETRKVRFSNFRNYNLDNKKLIGLLPAFKWIIIPVGAIVYFFAVVWALITTALFAVVGSFMVKKQIKDKINFAGLWNISVYSLTLPWILDAAKNLIFPNLPFFFIVKWAVALLILNKAVGAVNNRFSEVKPEPQDVLI